VGIVGWVYVSGSLSRGYEAMTKVRLRHGKDARRKKMGAKIIADQEKEIAQMQDWLKKNAK
jgi:uncharacterized protein (DUF305 family)